MTKALVVLSGGQDSTTCLFWACKHYEEVHAITFDYGQRHSRELEAAFKVAQMAGVVSSHEMLKLGPVLSSTSPLVNRDTELETYHSYEEMDQTIGDRVELTFVPMRNALFLTIAMNRAIACGARAVVTGVCQQDNANYPDCRSSFILAMENMARQALDAEPPRIITPLMNHTKADTVRLARTLPGCMEALAYSHTAYDGQYPPTGRDHASVLRAQGFLDAGVPDPLVVRAWREGLMALPETSNYRELAA